MSTKSELRKEMKARRKDGGISPASTFLKQDWKEEVFFVYRSFSTEAETESLITALKKKGKIVLTPRVEGAEMVAVLDEGEEKLSSYGIKERTGKAYEGKIDVAVIPLLAATREGKRLGYGGGYYDKFLKTHPTKKVGYAYSYQIVPFVPTEETDVTLDYLCTEEEFLKI